MSFWIICFSGVFLCMASAYGDPSGITSTTDFIAAPIPQDGAQNTSTTLPSGVADALTLEQAVTLATQLAPQVQAGVYKQTAAAADIDRAGRLPDPQLQFGVQNLDMQGAGAFNPNADFMTMRFVGVNQDIPSTAALRAERSKAEANQSIAVADTEASRYRAKLAAATAWIDLWAAQRAILLLAGLSAQSQTAIATAQARLAAAKGTVMDVLAARAASSDIDNQIEAMHGNEQQAYATLSRWVRSSLSHATLADPPDFSKLPVTETRLLQQPDSQVPLLVWSSRVTLAEADLQRAQASKQPDWNVGLSYGIRAPGLPALGTLQVGMRLPLFSKHREDQDIDARSADLAAIRADQEDARRAQMETVRRSLANWQSLNAQIQRYQSSLLPLVNDRTKTALAAYRGGGSLEPWLNARSAEITANLNYLNTLVARARAWAELAYLIPENKQ